MLNLLASISAFLFAKTLIFSICEIENYLPIMLRKNFVGSFCPEHVISSHACKSNIEDGG
jgi:hypothetical protein